MPHFESFNEDQTSRIAATIAARAQRGDIFTLKAPMGAGKSVFARGFIRALCGENTEVPSPTFTLVQIYDSPTAPISHFDLYRLEHPDDVLNIGWDDAISDSICLIEWPEKAGTHIPQNATNITIEILSEHKRKITIGNV